MAFSGMILETCFLPLEDAFALIDSLVKEPQQVLKVFPSEEIQKYAQNWRIQGHSSP